MYCKIHSSVVESGLSQLAYNNTQSELAR